MGIKLSSIILLFLGIFIAKISFENFSDGKLGRNEARASQSREQSPTRIPSSDI